MKKTLGYNLIVTGVEGFNDARAQISRLIKAGVVKCGQCDKAATHVFWQDQAEWYCRCDQHPEGGPQWTGSTRWNPNSFGISVLKDQVRGWLKTLSPDERKRFGLRQFDATNYWDLMTDTETRHTLTGSAEEGVRVSVVITLLTNGEYVYQISRAWGRSCYTDAVVGAWPTEAEALEAANADLETDRGSR